MANDFYLFLLLVFVGFFKQVKQSSDPSNNNVTKSEGSHILCLEFIFVGFC